VVWCMEYWYVLSCGNTLTSYSESRSGLLYFCSWRLRCFSNSFRHFSHTLSVGPVSWDPKELKLELLPLRFRNAGFTCNSIPVAPALSNSARA